MSAPHLYVLLDTTSTPSSTFYHSYVSNILHSLESTLLTLLTSSKSPIQVSLGVYRDSVVEFLSLDTRKLSHLIRATQRIKDQFCGFVPSTSPFPSSDSTCSVLFETLRGHLEQLHRRSSATRRSSLDSVVIVMARLDSDSTPLSQSTYDSMESVGRIVRSVSLLRVHCPVEEGHPTTSSMSSSSTFSMSVPPSIEIIDCENDRVDLVRSYLDSFRSLRRLREKNVVQYQLFLDDDDSSRPIFCEAQYEVLSTQSLTTQLVCNCHSIHSRQASSTTDCYCVEDCPKRFLGPGDVTSVASINDYHSLGVPFRGFESLTTTSTILEGGEQEEEREVIAMRALRRISLGTISESLLYGPTANLSASVEAFRDHSTSAADYANLHSFSALAKLLCDANDVLLAYYVQSPSSASVTSSSSSSLRPLYHYVILFGGDEGSYDTILLRHIAPMDRLVPIKRRRAQFDQNITREIQMKLESIPRGTYSPMQFSSNFQENVMELIKGFNGREFVFGQTTQNRIQQQQQQRRPDVVVIDDEDEDEDGDVEMWSSSSRSRRGTKGSGRRVSSRSRSRGGVRKKGGQQ